MTTIAAKQVTEKSAPLAGIISGTPSNKPTEKDVKPTENSAKEEKKPTQSKPKKQASNSKKVTVPAQKEAKKAAEKKAKPKKLTAKEKNVADYTLLDARSRMRDANKESKTLSGALKIIGSFWNEGYKDAFAAIGLTKNDLTVPNIQKMWHKDLKVDNVFAYKTKVAIFTKSDTGEKIFQFDADGKKVTETVLKEFNNNFTPLRIFEALYYTQYQNKKCVFQISEKNVVATKKENEKTPRTKRRAASKAKEKAAA